MYRGKEKERERKREIDGLNSLFVGLYDGISKLVIDINVPSSREILPNPLNWLKSE